VRFAKLSVLITVMGLASVLLTTAPNAQAETQSTFSNWTALFSHVRLGTDSPWSLYLESQSRLNADVATARGNRLLLRTGIRYQIDPHWSATAGYAWTPNFSPLRTENRLWQQLQYTQKHEVFLWSSRTRLEQRWIEPRLGSPDSLQWRLREFIRAQWWPDTSTDAALALWNELFVTPDGFDQNRAFIGINLGLSNQHRLEVGYLNLFQRSLNATPHLMAHTLGIFLFSEFQ
jgi:hypothetical protein